MRALLIAMVLVPASAHAQSSAPLELGIDDAMRIAIGASHPLTAARANAAAADADVTAARAGYLPQIVASGSYLRTLASEFRGLFDLPMPAEMAVDEAQLPFGPEHTWRGGLDVTQSIWDGGRTRANVALATTAREVAGLDVQVQRAQAILEATQAYYDAQLAADAVAIGESSLRLAERTLGITRTGFEQGTTAEFDVLRAEVTRDNQRTLLIRARADRHNAMLRLRQRLGLPLDRPLALAARLDEHEAPALAADLAGVSLRPARAPVARARAAIDTLDAQIALERAALLPQISAFSQMGIVQYPFGFLPDEGDWRKNWTVGVALSWTLFDGNRARSRVASAEATRRAAEAELVQVSELAALDERRTLTDIEVAAATVAETRRSAELAERAAQIAEVRYNQGVSTYVELTDARIALDRARINLATARRDLHVSRVRAALLPLLPLQGGDAATEMVLRDTANQARQQQATQPVPQSTANRANLPQAFAPGATLPGTQVGTSGF